MNRGLDVRMTNKTAKPAKKKFDMMTVAAIVTATIGIFAVSAAAALESNDMQRTDSMAWFVEAVNIGQTELADNGGRCESQGDQASDGQNVRAFNLIKFMTGFAREAGTTGGLGKPLFLVTNLEDKHDRMERNAPSGSLREAMEKARQAGGGWIMLSDDILGERRINLSQHLFVPSNTTLDGGCHGLTLTTPDTSVLVLRGVDNVILTRLNIEQRGPVRPGIGDCINISDTDRVWVAFNMLRRCEDGLVDVGVEDARARPIRVTIAFNHFAEHDKDILLASYDCKADPARVGCGDALPAPWDWRLGMQITLQGNLFDRTGQRHPRLAGLVYAHLLDNIIAFQPFRRANGRQGAAYGSFAGAGSRLLVENNLYVPLTEQRGAKAVWAEVGRSAVRLVANTIIGSATTVETQETLVPPPPYRMERKLDFSDPTRAVACAASRVRPTGASRVSPTYTVGRACGETVEWRRVR